jgi:hypothetical protein
LSDSCHISKLGNLVVKDLLAEPDTPSIVTVTFTVLLPAVVVAGKSI